jgi:hypothetical protein
MTSWGLLAKKKKTGGGVNSAVLNLCTQTSVLTISSNINYIFYNLRDPFYVMLGENGVFRGSKPAGDNLAYR